MIRCDACKFNDCGTEDYPCSKCDTTNNMFKPKAITNADKIRAMNDEELAEFFSKRDKIPNRCKCREIEDWIKWLQFEAE